MSKKKEMLEQLQVDGYVIYSEFANEHGEEFVLFYRPINSINNILNQLFVTGDEFDWELGYMVGKGGSVYQPFIASLEENAKFTIAANEFYKKKKIKK